MLVFKQYKIFTVACKLTKNGALRLKGVLPGGPANSSKRCGLIRRSHQRKDLILLSRWLHWHQEHKQFADAGKNSLRRIGHPQGGGGLRSPPATYTKWRGKLNASLGGTKNRATENSRPLRSTGQKILAAAELN